MKRESLLNIAISLMKRENRKALDYMLHDQSQPFQLVILFRAVWLGLWFIMAFQIPILTLLVNLPILFIVLRNRWRAIKEKRAYKNEASVSQRGLDYKRTVEIVGPPNPYEEFPQIR